MSEMPAIYELNTDLGEVEAPELLPKGDYKASVTNAVIKPSQSGNTLLQLTYTIHPDDFPHDFAADNAPDGLQITNSRTVINGIETDKRKLHRLKEMYKKHGLDPKGVRAIDPTQFMGAEVMLSIKHGEYDGQVREEFDRVEKFV